MSILIFRGSFLLSVKSYAKREGQESLSFPTARQIAATYPSMVRNPLARRFADCIMLLIPSAIAFVSR
jgi:hypothetical protein